MEYTKYMVTVSKYGWGGLGEGTPLITGNVFVAGNTLLIQEIVSCIKANLFSANKAKAEYLTDLTTRYTWKGYVKEEKKDVN